MPFFEDVNDTDFRRVLHLDDATKQRVASQIAHAHTDEELAEVLASADPIMVTYIRTAVAKLGRRVQ